MIRIFWYTCAHTIYTGELIMFNKIAAVVLGYMAMFVTVFVCLTAAYAVMGADGAFEPGSFEVTMPWIVVMFIVNIIAGIIGGIACAKVSNYSKRAVQSLMLLIVLLGLFLAFSVMNAPAEVDAELVVRDPDIKMSDAMMSAEKPTWMLFADPFVGVLGILIGAMIVCPDRKKGSGSASYQD